MEIQVSSTPAQEVQPIQINAERLSQLTQQDREHRYGKVTESDLVAPREGLLATARTTTGLVAQEIGPETIVTFRGVAMTVDRAVKAGILRSNGQGGYQEVSEAERVAQQAQTEQRQQQALADQMAPEVDLHVIDREAPGMLAELVSGAESHGYALERLTMEMVGKPETFWGQTLPTIARHMGVDPKALADQMDRVGAAVINQIKATVQPMGVDTDGFIDWLDKQGSRGAAAYAMALRGQFLPVKQMVAKYKETNAGGRSNSPHVHKTPGGKRVVTVSLPNGQTVQMSEATAIRDGWI